MAPDSSLGHCLGRARQPREETTSEAYDYVIVGAGTAGCLLANRLSADPQARVLLLEAGGSDAYHWIRIPVGYLYCIGNPRTDWMYQTEPDPGLNGRRLRYPRGKVLGGCSSINGMIYMRGQARDYDSWAEILDDPEWSWERALPDFVAHESHWRMAAGPTPEFARFHGSVGRTARREAAGALSDPRRLRRRLRAGRHPGARRLQRRRQRGGRILRGEPARRAALERRQRISEAGAGAEEPDRAHRRRGGAAPVLERSPEGLACTGVDAGRPAPGWQPGARWC